MTDVVNAVVEDLVISRIAFAISPGPTNRDSGVIEIVDFIVLDPVVGALPNPDTDGTGEESTAFSNNAVIHHRV